MEDRPSSQQIGRDLEDQIETLLRTWSVPYRRQLRALRDELDRAHAQRVAPAVSRPTSPIVQKLRK